MEFPQGADRRSAQRTVSGSAGVTGARRECLCRTVVGAFISFPPSVFCADFLLFALVVPLTHGSPRASPSYSGSPYLSFSRVPAPKKRRNRYRFAAFPASFPSIFAERASVRSAGERRASFNSATIPIACILSMPDRFGLPSHFSLPRALHHVRSLAQEGLEGLTLDPHTRLHDYTSSAITQEAVPLLPLPVPTSSQTVDSPLPPPPSAPNARQTDPNNLDMFAPAAPLARAVSKARTAASHTASEIQDDLHAAEQLYAEATHPEDEGQGVPEELDADEAEEVIEDEYRPLMDGEGEQDGEGQRGENGANGKGTKNRRKRWDEEGGEAKVRKFEVWLTQLIFFVRPPSPRSIRRSTY